MHILPSIREENDWVMYVVRNNCSEQTIYYQILHTVWYISGERLKEKIEVDHKNVQLPTADKWIQTHTFTQG